MKKEKINWDDPNLDLDEVLGIPDLDKIEGFTEEISNKTEKIIYYLDLKEDFTDSMYALYDGKDLLGVIEYSNEKGKIHIDFLGTINGNLNNVVSDNEFNEKFISYFGDITGNLSVKGLGRKLLRNFILKFESDTKISLVSLKGSEDFYEKVLDELEKEGLIIMISKVPEYEFIVI